MSKKRGKLAKEREDAEAAREEQLKDERSLGKAAYKNQTKPRRSRPD